MVLGSTPTLQWSHDMTADTKHPHYSQNSQRANLTQWPDYVQRMPPCTKIQVCYLYYYTPPLTAQAELVTGRPGQCSPYSVDGWGLPVSGDDGLDSNG